MNLLNFAEWFPDETSCMAKFKKYRDCQGIICHKCGCMEYYRTCDKESCECKHAADCAKTQNITHIYL